MDDLKAKAAAAGCGTSSWLTTPKAPGLTNLQYAPLAELSGRSFLTPEALNCAAPDTGNMEVLAEFGTKEQQERWLRPLLDGEIRSAFCMTEPDVASSDATNISTSIVRDGDVYVINGRKWWSSGAMDPRCQILIVMGKTNPEADRHRQQSQILVPRDTPGVDIQRGMHRLRLHRRDSRRPRGDRLQQTSAYRPRTSSPVRARASLSRRPGSGRAGSTTACARSARPSGLWS